MGLVERPFKAAMPAFLRAFFVAQAFLPVYVGIYIMPTFAPISSGPAGRAGSAAKMASSPCGAGLQS
jgi:hypothetical protein